jgi:hypothetical protein
MSTRSTLEIKSSDETICAMIIALAFIAVVSADIYYTLPPLPYAYDALEPFIDAATMHLHHDKHHQKYTDELNNAMSQLDAQKALNHRSVVQLLQQLSSIDDPIRTAIRNNGGGYINHKFSRKNLFLILQSFLEHYGSSIGSDAFWSAP